MRISLWYIGKNKLPFIDEGIKTYSKRIAHYCRFEVKMFKHVKNSESLPAAELLKREAEVYLNELQAGDSLILLDERGKEFDSRKFAAFLEQKQLHSTKHLIFAIGGAYGFSDELKKKASGKISLSKMTFSHQLIRVIFLEQLYRGFTIIKGEKYHND